MWVLPPFAQLLSAGCIHRMQEMTAQAKTARHLTVRNVPPELARALQEEKQRRGESLNQVVLDLLSQGLGVGAGRRRSNGLAELAGTWTQEELEEFEAAIAVTEQVDEELWR